MMSADSMTMMQVGSDEDITSHINDLCDNQQGMTHIVCSLDQLATDDVPGDDDTSNVDGNKVQLSCDETNNEQTVSEIEDLDESERGKDDKGMSPATKANDKELSPKVISKVHRKIKKKKSRDAQMQSACGTRSKRIDCKSDLSPKCEEACALSHRIWSYFIVWSGLTMMVMSAWYCTSHLYDIHENRMFFSNIMQVEREISFRTESGLYYSYYKQLVNATSISQGIYELTHDNLTEHLNTINILARFNIYQEVLLAILYRSLPILQSLFEPIYFYIDSIFALHGLLICALYSTAWMLTGTWLSGVLTAFFYIINRIDTTRVDWSIPLRESWALPFHWLQLTLITFYFHRDISANKQKWAVCGITLCTFLFSITWQFNQFVLLLQAGSLFALQLLQLVPLHKIQSIYYAQGISMLAVCCAQFFNTMILSGVLLSFLPAALFVMHLQVSTKQDGSIARRLLRILLYVLLTLSITVTINFVIKRLLQQDADEHIVKFALAKFGLFSSRDMDVSMYICNGAFDFLSWDFYHRMNKNLLFSVYSVTHACLLLMVFVALYQKWYSRDSIDESGEVSHVYSERPALVFHAVNCVFSALLAVSTTRMKYLWSPYICVLASFAISDHSLWTWFLPNKSIIKVHIIRHTIVVAVLAHLVYVALPPLLEELNVLQEFYDPDTVALMNWITWNTPTMAAFTGSMQLLAAVKLCTLRPITNHPHYEDKGLRYRTKQLYEMYSRTSAKRVHEVMQHYNTSYMILEDSICLSGRNDGCKLTDIMNTYLDNKVAKRKSRKMRNKDVPSFCDEVRHLRGDYGKYFKLVFENKTFRVYKII